MSDFDLFPTYEPPDRDIADGVLVPACSFCKKAVKTKKECKDHYSLMQRKPAGYYQCPFGFTTRTYYFDGRQRMITGVIGFPRFGSENERAMAKRFPQAKVARQQIDSLVKALKGIDEERSRIIEEAAKILPQALHELRKLNSAVLQHAEKELKERPENGRLISINSAAELMRNNFDILEALSNIDSMRALPLDSVFNVYDLAYKMKKVLNEKAASRSMGISVQGVRARAKGSWKSFPIVPAVLIENAIKYGRMHTSVRIDVLAERDRAILIVENDSDHSLDPLACFDRGSRYAPGRAEGGGYGLYLAREIVSAHKGTIRCELREPAVRMIVELPLYDVLDRW